MGRFGETFGEFPGIVVGMLSCGALLLTRSRKSRFSNISSLIFGSVFFVLFAFTSGIVPFNYLGLSFWYGLIFAMILMIIAVFVMKKIPTQKYAQIRKLAWIGLLSFTFTTITINMLKFGWSRVRFRDIQNILTAFTPWFLPKGFTGNTDWTSFPSGHVGIATVIFAFTLLPNVFISLRKYKTLILVTCYAWVIMVMLSRIIIGAHFLSDTIAGALIGLGCFFLMTKLFKMDGD